MSAVADVSRKASPALEAVRATFHVPAPVCGDHSSVIVPCYGVAWVVVRQDRAHVGRLKPLVSGFCGG